MKKLLALSFAFLLLFGCAPQKTRYERSYFDCFDTVTVLSGYACSEEEFLRQAEKIHGVLWEYHRLFDIYHEYDGIVNLASVNKNAGTAVAVDERIIDLLSRCVEIYSLTEGKCNVAMGAVTAIWHESRENGGPVPSYDELYAASLHTSIDCIVIDRENGTVTVSDPLCRLDVGAVAKGYAAGKAAGMLESGYVLTVGGNVCTSGTKPDGSLWKVGIEDPRGGAGYAATVSVAATSVVTSGGYQRYFEADGVRYHHIIDPDTLYPENRVLSVTVVLNDSCLADGFSTALFCLGPEKGAAVAREQGAEAMWIMADGSIVKTQDFPS